MALMPHTTAVIVARGRAERQAPEAAGTKRLRAPAALVYAEGRRAAEPAATLEGSERMESDAVASLASLVPLGRIVPRLWAGLWPALLIFSGIFVVEVLAGASRQRYLSRGFLIDVAHYVFYAGGFFNFLINNPLVSVMGPPLQFLNVGLLGGLHPVLAYVIYFVYLDFFSYWWHRALHQSRFLWAFHSVHHAPTQITGVTTLRRHIVEIFLATILTYIVVLPLGALTTGIWPIVSIIWAVKVLESVHHAELSWRFGRLGRIVVSPMYHSLHHSTDPAHHHKNYAIIFSFWDYLFGTAAEPTSRPRAYGIEGMGMSETLTSQVFTPFRNFFRLLRPARPVRTA
jgi:sterol desaturase/sphingolipid hydroxylase (fatty acid hydroxylase superfamily)